MIQEFKVDIICILPYCHHNDKVQYLNRIGTSLAEGTSMGYLRQPLERIQGIDRHTEKNMRVSHELFLLVNLGRILTLHQIG